MLTLLSVLRYGRPRPNPPCIRTIPLNKNNSFSTSQTQAVVNKDPTASMIFRLQAEVGRLRSLLTCTEPEAQRTGRVSFGATRKESDGQIAAIEGKIREHQISLARRDNLGGSDVPNRRLDWDE